MIVSSAVALKNCVYDHNGKIKFVQQKIGAKIIINFPKNAY